MGKNTSKTVKVRASIPIYYSSTTNTSKRFAYALANKLDENFYMPSIINVGEFDRE